MRDLVEPDLDLSVADAVLGPVASTFDSGTEQSLDGAADFARIYVRSRRVLENRARSFLSDSRDVEEVVQETFLRLFLTIADYEVEWQAIAFCHRVLTNLCIDRYRRDRRRPQVYDLDVAGAADVAGDDFTDHPLLQAEEAAIVRKALAELAPSHRAALVMREIEQRPLAEIAAALDIEEEKVKHLLFRARRSLRRMLTGSAVDPGVDADVVGLVGVASKRRAGSTLGVARLVLPFVVVGLLIGLGTRDIDQRTHSRANGALVSGTSTAARQHRPAGRGLAPTGASRPTRGPRRRPTQGTHQVGRRTAAGRRAPGPARPTGREGAGASRSVLSPLTAATTPSAIVEVDRLMADAAGRSRCVIARLPSGDPPPATGLRGCQ